MKQNGGSKINSRMTATIPVEVMPSHSQHPTCMEILVSHHHLMLVCCHRQAQSVEYGNCLDLGHSLALAATNLRRAPHED